MAFRLPRIHFLLLGLAVAIGSVAFWLRANTTPSLPRPPLKDLAGRHDLELGAYAALKRLDEQPYTDILTAQFDLLVIDGQPNWTFNDGSLRPGPDEYDFSRVDQVADFADRHGLPVRVQHMVWGEEKWLPDWLKHGGYSREQLLELIHKHIAAMGQRYGDRVHQWTVVNEAFTRAQHVNGLRDWWGDHIGLEYIEQSFVWAREADPDAVLILNDFGNEVANPVSDAMFEALKAMKQKNVPIDGLGMQMHIDGTKPPAKDDVIANMERFGQLGLDVYVTEFDVNMNDVPGSIEEKEARQADIYHEMMRACVESPYCRSFSVLGLTDKETWYNEMGVPNAMPLLFDRHYQPKPAYFSLRRALQ
jgi:endo-1,4-beta-xylanase